MHRPTLIAAILMSLTLGVHVIAGGQEVHAGLQSALGNDGLRAFAAVLWHAVTVVLVVFAIALLWLAWHPNLALKATLGAVQAGFAVIFLFYDMTRLGTVWPMPQWIIFLIIPALTLLPTRQPVGAQKSIDSRTS